MLARRGRGILPRKVTMNYLFLLATCCFIGSLSFRLLDPLVPEIARELQTTPESVALLTTAFLLSYAVAQPLVGAIGDAYGKVRVLKLCSAALAAMLAIMAVAPSIEVLYAARILGGVFGGGVFTIALAIVGDRVAVAERQVAMSKLIMASQWAQLFGVIVCGLIASVVGWRLAIGTAALSAIAATIMLGHNLQPRAGVQRIPFNLKRLVTSFGTLLRNPQTSTCYAGVFFDGMAVMGSIPFVAMLLEQRGLGGLREASFVIAGIGCGGLLYTVTVRRLLPLVGGMINMLRFGGLVCAVGLAGVAQGAAWPVQMAAYTVAGLGFFMLHASLQAQATDVAPELRATSISLHSTFFTLGTAIGPVLYAVGINACGARPSILIGALVILVVGMFTAARFEGLDPHDPRIVGEASA